jgi:hypothetical protein
VGTGGLQLNWQYAAHPAAGMNLTAKLADFVE